MFRVVVWVFTAVAVGSTLAGCTGSITGGSATMQGLPSQKLSITGTLSYPERVALPPESIAIIEVRDASSADGPVITEQGIVLQGRQVPIPFELTMDCEALVAGKPYTVRVSIVFGGRPRWTTEAVWFDPASETVDLGTLRLMRVKAEEVAITLRCGTQSVTVEHTNDMLRLMVGGETFDMRSVRAASGAKYEVVNDPSTTFWSKGDRATLVVRGRNYPECSRVETQARPFRATGNEPAWRLEITDTTMTLLADYEQTKIVRPTPVPETAADFRRYVAKTPDTDLRVTIFDRFCNDSMSGMPHPHTVTVVFDGRTLNGCGGEPATLLRGAEWVVEDLNGGGIIDRSRITLNFGADGRISGRASCNQYTGGYTLTGESLTLSQAATTRMACEPSLMNQEDKFLELLRNTRRFTLNPDGALILHTGDGRTITARRE